MDFDKAVAAFTKKKQSQNRADEKREAYKAMLKNYNELKFGKAVGGVRKEREITQEVIEKAAQDKKETSVDMADDLAQYFDINLDEVTK